MNTTVKNVSLLAFIFFILFALVIILVWKNQNFQTMTGNNYMCIQSENGQLKCGTSTCLFPEYLEKFFSKRYEDVKKEDGERQQQYLKDNKERLMSISDLTFWEAKPAARLTGKKVHDELEDDINAEMKPVREWNYGRHLDDTTSFIRHGVSYRNGRLVVPVDGTYFVYSLVDFFESCDPSTSKPNVKDYSKPIKHAIYKFNLLDNVETEIIANIQPHQISSNKYYNSYSSYVSSFANLKAGDEISVKVSNIMYLRHVKDNSFGLNLI